MGLGGSEGNQVDSRQITMSAGNSALQIKAGSEMNRPFFLTHL